MYYSVRGLILRETEYKDADKLLTVLTPQNGLITLRAHGVRSRSSRLKGACQLLCYSEFDVFENNGRASIREASAIESFPELRTDLNRLALASYFVQIAELVSQTDTNTSELLSLSLNAIYALCRLKHPHSLVKSVFEFRVVCHAGFMPSLEACEFCGSPEVTHFCIRDGVLLCSDCAAAHADVSSVPISIGALNALRYISHQQLKKLFQFRVSDAVQNELSVLTEAYLLERFERGFSALDFYKTIAE